MATADLSFEMELSGTPEEVASIVGIMLDYDSGKDNVYFSCTTINVGDNKYHTWAYKKEELLDAVRNSSGPIEISSLGPYGHYMEIDDVDIFREMAQAAPRASFTASISGFAGYADQALTAELADGLLHISTYYLSDDARGEAELEYFTSYLNYDKFLSLFRLEPEQFSSEMFEDFLMDNICCMEDVGDFFTETDYEEFLELLEVETPLTEEEYAQAVEELSGLDLGSYEDYLDEEGFAQHEEYTYDPIEQRYLDLDHPKMKAGVAYSINDNIREYLQSIGHPSDDEAINALSVDDVYAIMFGTYGKETPEENDETEAAEESIESTEEIEATEAESVEEADIAEANETAEDAEAEEIAAEPEEAADDFIEPAEAEAEEAQPEAAETESAQPAPTADTAAEKTDNVPKAFAPAKARPVWLIVLLAAVIIIALAAFVFCLGEVLGFFSTGLLSIAARLL